MKGIYLIKSGDSKYVGSSVRISKRWQLHLNQLMNNTHSCSSLQSSFDNNGITSLEFSILEIVPSHTTRNELWQKEVNWSLKIKDSVNRLPIECPEKRNKQTKEQVIYRLGIVNNYIPFYAIDRNNSIVDRFDFKCEALAKYNTSIGTVQYSLDNHTFTSFDIAFIKILDYENGILPSDQKGIVRPVSLYNIYGEFIARFTAITECAKFLECDVSNLHKKINTQHKTSRVSTNISKHLIYDSILTEEIESLRNYWKLIFSKLPINNGPYIVYDCFGKYICNTTLQAVANAFNYHINSVRGAVSIGQNVKTLKIIPK